MQVNDSSRSKCGQTTQCSKIKLRSADGSILHGSLTELSGLVIVHESDGGGEETVQVAGGVGLDGP